MSSAGVTTMLLSNLQRVSVTRRRISLLLLYMVKAVVYLSIYRESVILPVVPDDLIPLPSLSSPILVAQEVNRG